MPAKIPFCVYVLRSESDGQLYAGFSTDLTQRLTDHFHGRVPATAPRRPLALVYCEYHSSKADALRRESYFKTTAGKKGLKLMLREALARGAGASEMRPAELRVSEETPPDNSN